MNEVAMSALIHNSSETVQRVNECAVTSRSFQEFRVSVIAQRDLQYCKRHDELSAFYTLLLRKRVAAP